MDPNRNDSPNNPRKPGDGQKPRSNIWLALIIAVIALLAISGIYKASIPRPPGRISARPTKAAISPRRRFSLTGSST